MTDPSAQLGDDCPQCGAPIGVLNTRVDGDHRTRYLGCHQCGYRPPANKQIVPLTFAPRRRTFSRLNQRRR